MKYYDVDGDGHISYDEFVRKLREPLSERKQKVVDTAFKLLEKGKSGKVQASDIVHYFNVEKNPDFIAGKRSRENIIEEFLQSFVGGAISQTEWDEYHQDLAMSIPNDEYFIKQIENTWGISEDEQSGIFIDKVKNLLSMMRQRLLVLSNNSEEEFKLRKIFKAFDLDNSGNITLEELAAMLAKLGITVERKYIEAMLRMLD